MQRDLRDIAGGALPSKREDSSGTLPGRIVLQVQRVRNIAAPKSNEESKAAPRLLQLDLTDGQATLQALELEPVPALSLNVAPGSKIFFKAEKLQLMHGFLLLRSNELQLLGGRVDALYEKWEFARTMLKYARSGRPLSGASAPPPWVAFGKSIDANEDSNFKSLALAGDKDKPSKENDEFNNMRSEAIAVASKAGVKKVFGGGGQNIVDHNIKKILDKGYSKEEAQLALQATRNNLERALFNLKRRKDIAAGSSEPPLRNGRGERPGREGKRGASLKDEAEAAKPAAKNATLFDFLTTKLPAGKAGDASKTTTTSTADKPIEIDYKQANVHVPEPNKFQSSGERSRFENNVSSSFAANRGGYSGRGSRGGMRNRSGRDERPPREERPHRDERPPREDRPPRDERPPRDGRAARGGGISHSERAAAGGAGGNTRKQDSGNPRAAEQHGKGGNKNGQDHLSSVSKASAEQEQSSANKETGNNRRNSERPPNRNGYSQAENGNGSNNHNRRRQQQQANGASGSSAPAHRAGNPFITASEDVNTQLNKVIEETANLKIAAPKRENRRGGVKQSGGGHSSRQQNEPRDIQTGPAPAQGQVEKVTKPVEKPQTAQQQQQRQQENHTSRQHQPSHANYSQLPNGFTYDPSKIMGFQSKETNEFALSLMKSQGLSIASSKETLQQQSPPTKPQAASNNKFNSSQTGTAVTQVVTPVVPKPQPTPTMLSSPPEDFDMVPGNAWMWKGGDLCMAKYWDDGQVSKLISETRRNLLISCLHSQYYEAEVTAVSDKTCVVFFLGYGNHEEVLKTDILPITDAQNRPLSNVSQTQLQAQHQHQPQHHHQHHYQNQQHHHQQSRYRQGHQQQVYVPPHKRE